jgi:hypothetical protein
MENHHFQWENPLYMVIFNSYVKLPEGMCFRWVKLYKAIWATEIPQDHPWWSNGISISLAWSKGVGYPVIHGYRQYPWFYDQCFYLYISSKL